MKKLLFITLLIPFIVFARSTETPTVAVHLSGGNEVGYVWFSNNDLFNPHKEFIFDVEKPIINWNICYPKTECSSGDKIVFVQYLDNEKKVLGVAQQTITYQKQIQQIPKPIIKKPVIKSEPIITSEIETEEPIPEQQPVSNNVQIFGCTDSSAINYSNNATNNDGSCLFVSTEQNTSLEKKIITAGVTLGVVQTLFLFLGYGIKLAEIPLLISRFFAQFLIFIGARKKSTHWGTVTDSVSGQGLDPVVVTLYNEQGTEIKKVITDIQGRFGFLVPPGNYRVTVEKTHYTFPTHNGYKGELFLVSDESVINMNIPMQPNAPDWNEQEKQNTLSWWVIHRNKIYFIFSLLFYISLVFSFITFWKQSNLINGLFFIVNSIFLIIRLITQSQRSFGLVYFSNKKPVSGASVILTYPKTPDVIVKKIITDQQGRYYLLTNKTTYQVTILNEHNSEIFSDTILSKKGILKKDFIIQ